MVGEPVGGIDADPSPGQQQLQQHGPEPDAGFAAVFPHQCFRHAFQFFRRFAGVGSELRLQILPLQLRPDGAERIPQIHFHDYGPFVVFIIPQGIVRENG